MRDPYVYEGTDVLINKLNIRDAKELDVAETEYALALSCLYSASKKEYLLGIVSDSITVKNVSSKKYETIEGMEVRKYSYTNHTMKKLKTIEKPSDWKK